MKAQLERVGSVALAAGFCWAALSVQPPKLEVHTYHTQNAGIVLWDCGPGLEIWPLPVYERDGVLSIYPPWFMEHECS